jgi:asparagine synthase (glutamine-hydrolysing)
VDFVILPDSRAAAELLVKLAGQRRIDHASGRPWVIGDWEDGDITSIAAGTRRLVVMGRTRLDEPTTTRSLARMSSLHGLDAVASRLPGLFHLCASIAGETRAQGSLCTSRQIFFADVDGVCIAASGVAPLLPLTGNEIDEAVLAARLLAPGGPPWPLSQRLPRKGIHALEAGHWLRLDAAGRTSQVRWWSAPEASRSLPVAAGAVRAALSAALAVRAGATVSADLSGGLDSTCLCFLAAGQGADLVTYHIAPLDPANKDTAWAELAAAQLPSARHRVLPADRPENWFDIGYARAGIDADPEGPATWAAGLAHVWDVTGRAAGEGSSLHLTGIGGDELFGLMPAYPWSFARARPVRGLRLVNRYRLANRWALRATLRALADRSTFADSLTRLAGRISGTPSPLAEVDFGWIPTLRMPPWSTRDAVEAVRRLLRETAAPPPEPLDRDRLRHQILASVVFEGATIRHINTALAGTRFSWEAPFLDDRVIEAALSVRVEDRMQTGRVKPLLTTAVQDAVPACLLGRRDKGEFSAEAFSGLRRNQKRFLELCADSRLAELGLVDPVAFRAALLNPGTMSQHVQPFETTVACESWLRSHTWSVTGPVGVPS